MDSRLFLSLSLCFLLSSVLPLAHSALQLLGPKKTQESVLTLTNGVSSAPFDPTRVTQISWRPRAFIYEGFLTDAECDHLINLAKDNLEKSMVADNESGESVESEVRTSSGMFLGKAQDEVVAGIESRIAAWTFLPEENGEAMQILHYEHGQKYEPHFDYFYDKVNRELGGHRVATVLMYLSHVKRGGETVFPDAEAKDDQPKDDNWSDCAKNGYAAEEDAKILAYVAKHGIGNWTLVPQKAAKQLPGRTDNDVKNHWNTKLKKKLSKMGIDPVTHKPFSQILSDYGKISSLPNTGNQIGSSSFSMNNTLVLMPEPSLMSMELLSTSMINAPMQAKSFANTTNQEIMQPHFLTEVSSSTSSSSSCSWSAAFLLADHMDQKLEHDLQEMSSSAFPPKFSGGHECKAMGDGGRKKHCFEPASSSSANSFVDAILDRDSEMRLEFPECLNDYFNY
ncbi:oxoglutarate/iron-dependent oxygenase [Actinidia rufa]|uniref:procollagen-proline 4-dioxygenase n=1 Tax=Actinidia rufa TaxID=165716 RepID=A0A7J0DY30_9ERIC|nr:oxoglutarate/iron-dependent oxygenase [Actinidia rufa]